jgi:hypothetical protein
VNHCKLKSFSGHGTAKAAEPDEMPDTTVCEQGKGRGFIQCKNCEKDKATEKAT